MSTIKSVSLYFTEGSSDKEYHAQLEGEDAGYRVRFQYGRRGKPLTSGEKTTAPLSLEAATKVYDKLVSSKTAKGYTEQESGAVFSSTEHAGRITTFRPQLLNALTREQGLAHDGNWLAQEKHDGERRGAISARDGALAFSNRKGLEVGVQEPISQALALLCREIPEGFTLDAEDMGDHLMVFDVPEWPGQSASAPLSVRAKALEELEALAARHGIAGALKVDVPMPFSQFILSRLPEIEARGGEGYVLKDPDAPYSAGRPASGGAALKVKFTESATCRVSGVNGTKRSVGLELMDDAGAWTGVGNATIPVNAKIPEAGALVEIEYLYAYRGGALFQPVFKGLRGDIDDSACTMEQLKFKEKLDLELSDDGPGF